MKTVKKMTDLTASEAAALASAAAQIGIPKEWLFGLILAESGWNPTIKNRYASARGLIQWVDATAQALGYASSADLVAKNPTREAQLAGPVGEALVMTAAGLAVALPAVLAYNLLGRSASTLEALLEGFAHDLQAQFALNAT